MSLAKKSHIYEAAAKAIEAFEDRHYLGRKHFARLLGYRGPNAHIQLSSALNISSYNPANPKRLSVDQLAAILDEVDEEIRREMLERIVNHWGYGLCVNDRGRLGDEPEVMSVVALLLDMGSRHGGLESVVRQAIEDGVIDEEERSQIRERAFELRALVKQLEELTEVRRG